MNWPGGVRCGSGAALATLVVLASVMVGSLLTLDGCGTGGAPQPVTTPEISDDERQLADRLYQQLLQEQALQRDRKSLELSYELIDRYPAYERNDEVTLRAIRSAQSLGDLPEGRRLVAEFLVKYPTSPLLGDVLQLGVNLAVAEADTAAAADLLIRLYDQAEDGRARQIAVEEAKEYLPRMTADELATLIARYPDSGLRPYLSFLLTGQLLAAGRSEEAVQEVAAMRAVAADSEWTAAAEKLLIAPGYLEVAPHPRLTGAETMPNQIGILCPLTGRFAVLGNAFYDGALLALDKINSMSGRQFELKVEDTAGDPVTAAIAARRLADEAGSIAIIGAMMSDPTVAAALVADVYGIPLVSPTATNECIWELGADIFQTNLTGHYEAGLMARIATKLLMKKRFAVLYADTREGARSYQLFADQLRSYGGALVGAVSFSREATDFRQPILELKPYRPEVVFIHASVDQMILLGPQLDFYKVGALIMGLSNWNSPRLFSRVSSGMDRALFPSDTALFPAEWTDHFHREWHPEHVPAEATPLALKAFQATMLVLDSLAREGVEERHALAAALHRRLEVRQIDVEGPEAFARVVRMYYGGEVVPFPATLFVDTWQAAADTLLSGADADSLTVPVGEDTLPREESRDLGPTGTEPDASGGR